MAAHEIHILHHRKANYDDLTHKNDSVLEANLVSRFCSWVVIEIAGVFEDGYGLVDAQGKKESTEKEIEECTNALTDFPVVIEFMEEQSNAHEDDEAKLK